MHFFSISFFGGNLDGIFSPSFILKFICLIFCRSVRVLEDGTNSLREVIGRWDGLFTLEWENKMVS